MRLFVKFHIFFFIISINCFISGAFAAGAGRSLEFDGIDDHVQVADHQTLDLNGQGTLEAWIRVDRKAENATLIHKGDGVSGEAYSLRFGAGDQKDRIRLIVNNGTDSDSLVSNTGLIPGKWYHIAAAWNVSGNMSLYINGVRDATRAAEFRARNSDRDLLIGARDTAGTDAFSGRIDEVRVWRTERSVEEIRAYMCRKPDPASETDLQGYWRFDEAEEDVCTDDSGNANTGTMVGMNPAADRMASGAAIGDASVHRYTRTGELTLAHADGDRMTLSDITGSPEGVQLYRVDAPPDESAAPYFWKSFGSARGYWGVFITGGTDPAFTLSYDYAGYPGIVDEDRLVLGYRKDNADGWKDLGASPDTGAGTIGRTGLAGAEYILGSRVDPRGAIAFGGPETGEHVRIREHSNFDTGTNGTIEAWLRIDNPRDPGGIVHRGHSANGDAYKLAFGAGADRTRVEFTLDDGINPPSVARSTTNFSAGRWYHVAGVWDNDGAGGDDRMALYVNGILEDDTAAPRTPKAGNRLCIGSQLDGADTFEGTIDEVRIWNIDRGTADIREAMCRKLSGGETGLIGYWRFDEGGPNTDCPDYTGNANAGTLIGFSAETGSGRVCSSAPIGDASAYDYTGGTIPGPGDFSATLSHPDGDSATVTGDGGTWSRTDSGLQIYRIDEPPAYPTEGGTASESTGGLTPPDNWSSIAYTRYWGVFVAGGTSPTFKVAYNHAGNPDTPADGAALGLAARNDYCDANWTDCLAVPDTGAGTLTASGQTAAEYVLGGKTAPLDVRLSSFTGTRTRPGGNPSILLQWETAIENDTLGFFLLRSDRRQGPYSRLPGVFLRSEAVSEETGAVYRHCDPTVGEDENRTYFYKLEEEDYEPDTPNRIYGPVEVGPGGLGLSDDNSSQATEPDEDGGGVLRAGCFVRSLLTP